MLEAVAQAVVVDCKGTPDGRTRTTSHEVLESGTDPRPSTARGYIGLNAPYAAWDLALSGTEIGDMCEHRSDSLTTPADLGFAIQRTWSNVAAAALKDPCVPASGNAPTFGAVPALPDSTVVKAATAEAVKIPVGQQRTIDVKLYSAGPTSGPFTVTVRESPNQQALGLSLDRSSGQDGDVLHLTIKANAAASAGYAPFILYSTLNGVQSFWVGAVVN